MAIKLIVGLRNPGPAYAETRHNAGAWLLTEFAKQYQLSFKIDKKFLAEVADMSKEDFTCKLLMPLTFMNESGRCIHAICQFYRINLDEVLVVHDDLDLPVGSIKLKKGGGHGGHNGLRDIIQQMSSQEFYRLRIGIGHPGPGNNELVVNYVLGKPSKSDKQLIDDAIDRSLPLLPTICKGDINIAMNQLNTRGNDGI